MTVFGLITLYALGTVQGILISIAVIHLEDKGVFDKKTGE